MRSIVLLGALCASSAAVAAPSATDVLASVQKFYASAPQLTAKFRQTVTNKTFGTTESNDGRILVTRPIKLRAEYLMKTKAGIEPKKTFIYDGTTLWYLDHVNKEITRTAADHSVLPAAVSFLTGGDALATDFTVTLDTSGAYGKDATVLRLVPKAPSAQIKELRFVVTARDGHIHRSIVLDPKGDTNDFAFYEPDVKTRPAPALFAFDPKAQPLYRLQGPAPAAQP
ncbi:MAG: outer membrane lipoprotein carrier protein LolA [Proteobacteria bacterium]|nr:outer membrane lipoprotein carrier protein LolA [Pseudomonadota bacterium]